MNSGFRLSFILIVVSFIGVRAQTHNELYFEFGLKIKIEHLEFETIPESEDIEIFVLHGPAKFQRSRYEIKTLPDKTFEVVVSGIQEYLAGGGASFYGNIAIQVKKKAKDSNVYGDGQYANYYLALDGYYIAHDSFSKRKNNRQSLEVKLEEPIELKYQNRFIVVTQTDVGPSFEYYEEYLLCDEGVNHFPYLTSPYRTAPRKTKPKNH
ncbi:hypothetical protein ACNR9Q_06005 [Maribacter sp. X9]|uniref:hypothetical protein n=1 Tax=Maribacter sp. X9 TaxID=3402159 RepID=UPI003AF3BC80